MTACPVADMNTGDDVRLHDARGPRPAKPLGEAGLFDN